MASTFWDIKTIVWDLLGTNNNSTNFSSTKIWKKINAKIREVLRWRVKSLLDPMRVYWIWKISFMEWKTSLRTLSWWALTSDLEIVDTTLDTSTTYLNTSWYVEIWGEIITYTWKTSTSLTWVSWQTAVHKVWDTVIQLYTMPSDLEQINSVFYTWVWEIPYSEDENMTIFYTVYKQWTDNLLKIVWLNNDQLINISYTKLVSDLVTDEDECLLPDEYWEDVIWPLVAWEYALKYNLPTSQAILIDWYWQLQTFYQFYSKNIRITKRNIKAIPYKFNSIR